MMINRSVQSGVAVLAVLLGTAAMAQQDSASKPQEKSSQRSMAQSEQQKQQKATGKRQDTAKTAGTAEKKSEKMAPAVVVGDIVEMRTANLKGREGSHRLIKVKMQDGNTAVIDAGSAQPTAAATKDLQQGDRIVAVGRSGRINDRPVLVARRIGEVHITGVTGSKQSAAAGSSAGSKRKTD